MDTSFSVSSIGSLPSRQDRLLLEKQDPQADKSDIDQRNDDRGDPEGGAV
jgi:hypothetical protein